MLKCMRVSRNSNLKYTKKQKKTMENNYITRISGNRRILKLRKLIRKCKINSSDMILIK